MVKNTTHSHINDCGISQKPIIPVVFSTDHNFIMPTGVSIQSMLKHSTDVRCEIYIFQADNVTEEDRDILRSIQSGYDASMSFITMGAEYKDLFEIRNISYATYFRLMIPWILPQLDKVCYIDGDTVFIQSISKLYHEATKPDKLIFGVSASSFKKEKHLSKYVKKIGADENYINAGILVFNSKLQRENNLRELYLHHMQKKYIFQDQDIINIVCKGNIGYISRNCNFSCKLKHFPNYRKEDYRPIVIHYAGDKPWNTFTYGWDEWWTEYKESPFYDENRLIAIERSVFEFKYTKRQVLTICVKTFAPQLYRVIKKFKSNL